MKKPKAKKGKKVKKAAQTAARKTTRALKKRVVVAQRKKEIKKIVRKVHHIAKKQTKSAKPFHKQKARKAPATAAHIQKLKTVIGADAKPFTEAKTDVTDGMHRTKMRIIGIGGGGGSVIAEIAQRVGKTDFVAANTDLQALHTLPKNVKLLSFGYELTHGLGCGMDADLGMRAANLEKEKIKKAMEGQDICVLVAALGGGTGSGAVPVFAEVSRELKNLTIGIFTMPFSFEGEKRKQMAETALERVKPYVNAYVVIPNEKIFSIIDKKTPFKESLSAVNRRLASTLEGFIETIFLPGLVNIDFADVRSILEGRGRLAYLNSAKSAGSAKAQEAAKEVLANPLNAYAISGADRMLFNITGDKNLKMQEVAEISAVISKHNPKAKIIFGISFHPKFKDALRITLFAVGCEQEKGGLLNISRSKEFYSEKHIAMNTSRKKPILKTRDSKKSPPKPQKQEPHHAQHEQEVIEEATLKMPFPPNPPRQLTGGGGGGDKPAAADRSATAGGETGNKFSGIRRSGLELKKAVDEEIKELEEKEKQWDIPSFLRRKPLS